MADSVSPALARRVALAAQGLGRPHPAAAGTRRLAAEIRRLGLLQIDSVNVFERSHHLPVLARVGPYDRAALDRMLFGGGGAYTEYWAHQAAVLPVEDLPLFGWRMAAERARRTRPGSWALEHAPLIAEVRAELARTGPVPASAIEHESNVRTGPWWGWSDVKRALEAMFAWGEIASAGRRGFERVYGLAEDVLPAAALDRAVPEEDAVRELVRRAAIAHGIGTAADLGDYHRPTETPSPQAQIWFDRGMVWSYAFNHEEAIRCFERALRLDRPLPAPAALPWLVGGVVVLALVLAGYAVFELARAL